MKRGINLRLLVSAVRYLNTWPLVWGFLHGPQHGKFQFRFDLPVDCALALGQGRADIGLVPCAELARLGMGFFPGLGIATEGPVRSILLISTKPFREIRTLAADAGSRTSVALTRILLREVYGCKPFITRTLPDLKAMLAAADAALIIGDPALRIDPADLGELHVLDLGEAWVNWSGLPMVFAVWAAKEEFLRPEIESLFRESYEWGRGRIGEMLPLAEKERGFDRELVRGYLTRNIVYELGPEHLSGLGMFRKLAAGLEPIEIVAGL